MEKRAHACLSQRPHQPQSSALFVDALDDGEHGSIQCQHVKHSADRNASILLLLLLLALLHCCRCCCWLPHSSRSRGRGRSASGSSRRQGGGGGGRRRRRGGLSHRRSGGSGESSARQGSCSSGSRGRTRSGRVHAQRIHIDGGQHAHESTQRRGPDSIVPEPYEWNQRLQTLCCSHREEICLTHTDTNIEGTKKNRGACEDRRKTVKKKETAADRWTSRQTDKPFNCSRPRLAALMCSSRRVVSMVSSNGALSAAAAAGKEGGGADAAAAEEEDEEGAASA